jgi:hypothetical protein
VAITKAYKRYRSDGTFDFIDGHTWRRGELVIQNTGVLGLIQNLMKKLNKH